MTNETGPADGIEASSEAASDGDGFDGDGNGDETTPHVDLQLHQIQVRVSGRSDDELEDVAAEARGLMDYLVEKAESLKDQPDDRGLS